MADDFKALIAKVATGESLTRAEAASAFDRMMSGEATPSQMGALLMALRVRGETVDEITGAVTTMRAKMLGVKAPPDAIDVVGTGGDASGSFNISTCAAFIVAGAGVPVAKHGNRALSSKSGAADVLQALGVKIELNAEQVGHCIRDAGIGFMFAPAASVDASEAKALNAAAQKALAGEIEARATKLSQASNDQIVLAADGALRWIGDLVAKLIPGDDVLRPRVRIVSDEQLTGPAKELVQTRLDLWLKTHIEKVLAALFSMSAADDVTGCR